MGVPEQAAKAAEVADYAGDNYASLDGVETIQVAYSERFSVFRIFTSTHTTEPLSHKKDTTSMGDIRWTPITQ
jgi:hypothetical protein